MHTMNKEVLASVRLLVFKILAVGHATRRLWVPLQLFKCPAVPGLGVRRY